jgi:2-polyprenyl-3-methyl-5-hydroxy-6-metoxy-1,4-benzoquinol methylase
MTDIQFGTRPEGSETMAAEMPNAKNYYQWTVSQLTPYLGSHILDIGGGYGAHLEHILRQDNIVLSLDLSIRSVRMMKERFKDYPGFDTMCADFGQEDIQERLSNYHFDTITCLNVLEHIEDDAAALKDMYRILEPQKGTLLLQVPALEWLYGSLDQQAGHFRRYSLRRLRRILVEANFKIIRLHYFNFFGVLPWFINARIFKRSVASGTVDTQIRIFDRYLVPPLRLLETAVSPPLGQSLIAVATTSET